MSPLPPRAARLLKRGRFHAARTLLRRHCAADPDASPLVWQTFLMSSLQPVAAFADADAALAYDPVRALKGRRVLVLCDENADLRLVWPLVRKAASARVLLEGRAKGTAAAPRGVIVESARAAFPLYDVVNNTAAAQCSTDLAERAISVFSDIFARNPATDFLRGHERALVQSIEPFFMEYAAFSDGVRRLLDSGEIDYVALLLADGLALRVMASGLIDRLGSDRVLLARSKRRVNGDTSFFAWVSRMLKRRDLVLTPKVGEISARSRGAPPPVMVYGKPVGRRWADHRRRAFRAGLAMRQLRMSLRSAFLETEAAGRSEQGVFFPAFAGASVVARGDRALVEALFRNSNGAFLVEDLKNAEALEAPRRFVDEIEKSLENGSVALCDRESTLGARRSQAQFQEEIAPLFGFTVRLLLRSERASPLIPAPRELINPRFIDKLVRSLGVSAEKVVAARAFVETIRPAFVALYPPALPASRAMAVEAQRIGAPVIDIQPFFIMDEPRTRFHWMRAGDMALIQSSAFRSLYRKLGYPEEAIRVTGTPRLDHLMYRPTLLRPRAKTAKRILFAGQMLEHGLQRKTFETLAALAKRRGDVVLTFKPHYMAKEVERREVVSGVRLSACVRVCGDADIYDLIDESDVVVTYFSNVALEAAIRGRDVVCVTPEGQHWPEPMNLADWGVAERATPGSSLHAAVTRLLDDPHARRDLAERRRRYFMDNPQSFSQPAIASIVHAIHAIARSRHEAESPARANMA